MNANWLELVIGSESGEGPQLPSVEPPSERLPPDRVVVDLRPEAHGGDKPTAMDSESLAWNKATKCARRSKAITPGSRERVGVRHDFISAAALSQYSASKTKSKSQGSPINPGTLAVALRGHPRFRHSGIRAFVRQVGHDLRLQAQERRRSTAA